MEPSSGTAMKSNDNKAYVAMGVITIIYLLNLGNSWWWFDYIPFKGSGGTLGMLCNVLGFAIVTLGLAIWALSKINVKLPDDLDGFMKIRPQLLAGMSWALVVLTILLFVNKPSPAGTGFMYDSTRSLTTTAAAVLGLILALMIGAIGIGLWTERKKGTQVSEVAAPAPDKEEES